MKNLQLRHDGTYRYRTADIGNVVTVEIYYYKSDNLRRRGISVHVTPQEVRDGCVSTVLLSGYSVFAMQLARKNDKLVAQVASKLDEKVPEIARLFEAGLKAESKALVETLLRAEVVAA
jgi:hypothetical protein